MILSLNYVESFKPNISHYHIIRTAYYNNITNYPYDPIISINILYICYCDFFRAFKTTCFCGINSTLLCGKDFEEWTLMKYSCQLGERSVVFTTIFWGGRNWEEPSPLEPNKKILTMKWCFIKVLKFRFLPFISLKTFGVSLDHEFETWFFHNFVIWMK